MNICGQRWRRKPWRQVRSRHNLKLAERQVAKSKPNAVVVQNPVNLSDISTCACCERSTICFASVARLEVQWKRQDVLLEALSLPTLVVYGAAAKGNTLLNYCGIRTDFIEYMVDRSPHKQGLFLPGTHLPVYHPDKIGETQPDYLLILP